MAAASDFLKLPGLDVRLIWRWNFLPFADVSNGGEI
jgi:hypothetical protein